MGNIKAVQVFEEYLPITENWAYRLLHHTPDTDIAIFARRYCHTNFYPFEFKIIRRPDNYLYQADLLTRKDHPGQFLLKALLKGLRQLYPSALQALSRYLKTHPVDVVHSHFANVAWDFHRVVRQQGIPHVLSFYGWDYERLPFEQPAFRQHFQQLFAECAAIICEGPHGASTLINQGCPKEKIRIIHLGLDIDQIPYHPRQKASGQLDLIQIAAFSQTKGMIEAVEAFQRALADCPNMTYTIVGVAREPAYRKQLDDLIQRYDLMGKVKILPKIEYPKIHQFLRDFHVFIHPSRYTANMDCEGGAPIIILDAQATGLPVLATQHCDIPNEVLDQQTGFLVEEGDIEDLAAKLRDFYFMEQPAYEVMSRAARRHMEQQFEVQHCGQQLGAVYQEIKLGRLG
ncbi:MAG: glycosyltransferase family 4 protein [Bacteroidota bacterium]